jgi:hypothetical protein
MCSSMAEKTDKTTVQGWSKKSAKKPAERTQAAMLLAAKRARLVAQKKLAARNAAGIKAYVQPLTLEDVAMTVEDPGLRDAMQFSERLRTGQSRILSPEESKAAWQESDRRMAELQRLVAQKFGGPKP